METLPTAVEKEHKQSRISMGLALAISFAVLSCTNPKPAESEELGTTGYNINEFAEHVRIEGTNLAKCRVVLQENLPDKLREQVEELQSVLVAIIDSMNVMVIDTERGLVFATDEQMAEFRELHAKMDVILKIVRNGYNSFQENKPRQLGA